MDLLASMGGYPFAYQYLQGLYKPKFGTYGEGSLWLTPMREGVFYDERQNPGGLHGAYYFKGSDLILPKVFGIGEDLCYEVYLEIKRAYIDNGMKSTVSKRSRLFLPALYGFR